MHCNLLQCLALDPDCHLQFVMLVTKVTVLIGMIYFAWLCMLSCSGNLVLTLHLLVGTGDKASGTMWTTNCSKVLFDFDGSDLEVGLHCIHPVAVLLAPLVNQNTTKNAASLSLLFYANFGFDLWSHLWLPPVLL